MAEPGWRKLVDLNEVSTRQHAALEAFLLEHHIVWVRYTSKARHTVDPRFPEFGYRRYSVLAGDLCCAQAVLPAIEALGDEDDESLPPEAA